MEIFIFPKGVDYSSSIKGKFRVILRYKTAEAKKKQSTNNKLSEKLCSVVSYASKMH